jgi:hypothetical protein
MIVEADRPQNPLVFGDNNKLWRGSPARNAKRRRKSRTGILTLQAHQH